MIIRKMMATIHQRFPTSDFSKILLSLLISKGFYGKVKVVVIIINKAFVQCILCEFILQYYFLWRNYGF